MRTISSGDITQRIRDENPWWEGDHSISPFYGKMRPRPYFDLFFPLVKTKAVRRAVVLMGPRRVGKTVLIHHTIKALLDEGIAPKSILYLSVDHPTYSGLSLEQMLEFYLEATGADYKSESIYVFFDEIQYRRKWEQHLKVIVDSRTNIKCVAAGFNRSPTPMCRAA